MCTRFGRESSEFCSFISWKLSLERYWFFCNYQIWSMMQTVELRVGMSCQGCVGAVKRVLGKMEGSYKSLTIDISCLTHATGIESPFYSSPIWMRMFPSQVLHWVIVEALLKYFWRGILMTLEMISHIFLMAASCQIDDWTNLSLRLCLAFGGLLKATPRFVGCNKMIL